MTVFVDELMSHGWKLRGRPIANCHMFSDSLDLGELHAMAAQIGMKKTWFQDNRTAPHYDLTPNRRIAAVAAGAIAIGSRQAVTIWRARREALQALRLGNPAGDQRA